MFFFILSLLLNLVFNIIKIVDHISEYVNDDTVTQLNYHKHDDNHRHTVLFIDKYDNNINNLNNIEYKI
jgi:hypothetical protein